ncbi:cupin domain-containing protein [Nocardia sp. 348MFTsu5.1]|uniref:cupin domain-containing protein n=1 Tax=Nocardia sp. 348MFTsu5.1 TaxID=1172185 RepID=UPI00048AB06B|nr:cupin domain-containing protein [Nocardia sp. 348MFTsu5.1]
MIKHIRSVTAVVALSCAALTVPAVAHGTPSEGISAVTYADVEIPADLLPFIPEGIHAVAKQITIAPGGTTGWHYHDGPVVGIVQAGTLSHPGPDCKPVIFNTGALINEPAGDNNVHQGQNLGKVPVILDVVYLEPLGKPLFEDAPAPHCAAK